MGISGKRQAPVALTSGNGHRCPLNKRFVGTQCRSLAFYRREKHNLLNILSDLTVDEYRFFIH